jgi:hypothetical protein
LKKASKAGDWKAYNKAADRHGAAIRGELKSK